MIVGIEGKGDCAGQIKGMRTCCPTHPQNCGQRERINVGEARTLLCYLPRHTTAGFCARCFRAVSPSAGKTGRRPGLAEAMDHQLREGLGSQIRSKELQDKRRKSRPGADRDVRDLGEALLDVPEFIDVEADVVIRSTLYNRDVSLEQPVRLIEDRGGLA